jgi:hypothetical protein
MHGRIRVRHDDGTFTPGLFFGVTDMIQCSLLALIAAVPAAVIWAVARRQAER